MHSKSYFHKCVGNLHQNIFKLPKEIQLHMYYYDKLQLVKLELI